MCPAAEVALYSHRNPGEDISQALSTAGRNYSELPNAFAFRKAFNASCSCRGPGQTWSQALQHLEDNTVEQGDIIVGINNTTIDSAQDVSAVISSLHPGQRIALHIVRGTKHIVLEVTLGRAPST